MDKWSYWEWNGDCVRYREQATITSAINRYIWKVCLCYCVNEMRYICASILWEMMCVVTDISIDSSDSWELLHLNLITHFLCASEQTPCLCALPKLRDCSHHSALPFPNYNADICIVSEGLMDYPFFTLPVFISLSIFYASSICFTNNPSMHWKT